jgi:hypothetical protein
MSELAAALLWLKAQLTGIAPGGVHAGVAPPGTPPIFITIKPYGGTDRTTMNGTRTWAADHWLVQAWGYDTDYAGLDTAAKAIDAALQKQAGTVAGGIILQCIRLNDRLDMPMVGGVQWLAQGGVYEVLTRAN